MPSKNHAVNISLGVVKTLSVFFGIIIQIERLKSTENHQNAAVLAACTGVHCSTVYYTE